MDVLERRWRESERRSRERRSGRRARSAATRRWRERVGFAIVAAGGLGAAFALAPPLGTIDDADRHSAATGSTVPIFAGFGLGPGREPRLTGDREAKPRTVPTRDAFRSASSYADERGGLVSFAMVDSVGRLRGRDADRLYSAASVVKAMVLAAELDRLADTEIDATTDSLLTAMITHSDNEAADTIYVRVGDAGLHQVAKRAGMTGFTIAGHWGNAQITAADMARFFADLDRMLPRRHREYGRNLLASVIASQSWGIPEAAGNRWGVRFKGGWLPEKALVHQAAELRERGGPRQISIAVLTDEQPSHGYGIETVEGVASRLLLGR